MLEQILEDCHKACDGNGFLKNITIEEIKKINERNLRDCDYCPFEKCGSNICGGTLDILFYTKCYECNKCKKWSISDTELKEAHLRMLDEEYGL